MADENNDNDLSDEETLANLPYDWEHVANSTVLLWQPSYHEMAPLLDEYAPVTQVQDARNEELAAADATSSRSSSVAHQRDRENAGIRSPPRRSVKKQVAVPASAQQGTLRTEQILSTVPGRLTRSQVVKIKVAAPDLRSDQILSADGGRVTRSRTQVAKKKLAASSSRSSPPASPPADHDPPPPQIEIDPLAFLDQAQIDFAKRAKRPLSKAQLSELLSSLSQKQLINVLASAQAKHADVRTDLSKRASETKRKVFIHNFPLKSTPFSLDEIFTIFGKIEDVVIVHSKLDKDRRRGYVLFEYEGSAVEAVDASEKGMIDLVCHLGHQGCIEECLSW